MKKYFMLTVVIMLMAIVTAAQAEVKAGSVSLTPFAGYYYFEGNQDLKNSPIFGLRAGYNITEHLGLEGFFSYTQTEIQDESQWDPWQNVYSYGIEGLYHFMPESRFVPFIAIGIGGIHYSKGFSYIDSSYGERFESNKFAVDYGAGVKIFLTDDIALRADVRHVLPINNGTWNNPDNVHNDFAVTFGILFSFGGEKKIVAETMAEEPTAPKEAVAAAEPAPAPAPVVAAEPAPAPDVAAEPTPAPAPVAAAPAVTENLAPVSSKQNETTSIPEEDVRNLTTKWLTSWKSGDMKTYRSCYASDFQSNRMNLDAWISYKVNVRKNSKDINIHIDNLQISADENIATAVFTQYYSSSILNSKGMKTLELRKIGKKWKIYREIFKP